MHVKNATYLNDYKIEILFNDGQKGIADLSNILNGVFEPLKNKSLFSKFEVDKELDTITWANGTDIAPEYLYFLAFKNKHNLQEKFKKWGFK